VVGKNHCTKCHIVLERECYDDTMGRYHYTEHHVMLGCIGVQDDDIIFDTVPYNCA
jgi:hypothetical protein